MTLFRLFFIKILFSVVLFGSLFDFSYISSSEDNFRDKKFKEALSDLKSLNSESPEINYNMANNLYMLSRYEEALKYYKRSVGEAVDEGDRVYNIGNCYYNLKEYDNAIFAYKISLKHKDSRDTRYNLFIAKESKFKEQLDKERKKDKKKEKSKDGNSKKRDKKKLNKKRKLTKEDIKKMEEAKRKLKLKSMLKENLKSKKVPVLLYKIDTKESNKIKHNPW